MFSIFLFFILSFSHNPIRLKPHTLPHKLMVGISPQIYSIGEIGFYSLTLIKDKDEINILFPNQSSRLFLFVSNIEVNISITIDESSTFSTLKSNGLAIDAMNDVNVKFSFLKKGMKFNNESSEIAVSIWLLPLDLCPKSSFYGISGKELDAKIVPSSNTICAFSPIFNISNDVSDIQFGVDSINECKIGYSSLYTNDFNNPEETIVGYNNSKHHFLKNSYFIKYSIVNNNNFTCSSIDNNLNQTKIIFKKSTNKGNSNLPCKVSAVYSCSSNGCEDEIENIRDINFKCSSLTFIIFWTTSSSIGVIVGCVVLNILCLSLYCCYRCGCSCHNNDEEQLLNNNTEPLLTQHYTQDSLPYVVQNEPAVPNQITNYDNQEGFTAVQQNQNNNSNLVYIPQLSTNDSDLPAYLKPPNNK